ALDKSRFDGTRREDDINAFVKDFYKETKTLHDHFDSHKSTAGDVQTVLDRAAQIDQFMRRNRLKKDAPKDWTVVRAYLDELARVYRVTWRWQRAVNRQRALCVRTQARLSLPALTSAGKPG